MSETAADVANPETTTVPGNIPRPQAWWGNLRHLATVGSLIVAVSALIQTLWPSDMTRIGAAVASFISAFLAVISIWRPWARPLTDKQLPKPDHWQNWFWLFASGLIFGLFIWAQQSLITISGSVDMGVLPVYTVALTAVAYWLLELLSNNWESNFVAFIWKGTQSIVVALGALLAGLAIAQSGDAIKVAALIATFSLLLVDAGLRMVRMRKAKNA